jgi:hypothetical protein
MEDPPLPIHDTHFKIVIEDPPLPIRKKNLKSL